MNREHLKADDYSYPLSENRIAKYPLSIRNKSKLLSYKSGVIAEDVFENLDHYLPKDSVLVFNDTKVLSARLFFKKKTGARIEIFCLEPFENTVEQALTATSSSMWCCLVGNLKRFRTTDVLEMEIAGTTLNAKLIEKRVSEVIIQFDWKGGVEFSTILQEAGEIPLPPYLNRKTEDADEKNYQTVYARKEGAVAAPTAGLHFIEKQLSQLKDKGHELAYLTLFVGAGTFRAVKTDKLVEHQMHEERIVINKETIQLLADKGGKIISVGTTSLRSLESLYWLVAKMNENGNPKEIFVSQEDAYQLKGDLSWQEACEYLLQFMEENQQTEIDFYSSLFIMPSYRWKVIVGLITNFHQPKSTLLSLVSAWIGEDWRKVYDYALHNDFRFLSYGDSSILLR